ncbi:hypothetical protein PHLGIDRAFT_129143 [Phlebiopsis gigantea 11061_1 CR5-6]|uniref:Uncharacterized protein n=1 Tax=Phlebiopsis gigantea (strain 11061_1 CR5-6) TaxID=745531 RepID=A0A0C3NJD3_PHLG1|nr:hypothetical protein PHLGIDRAFT_129143 [Phlebiopsis gigantea 11061_1 CR5-6]
MKSFAAAAALAATVPFVLGQGGLQVNSLSGVIECEPVLISWSGGSPPYYLSFIPGGQPSAPAMKQFAPQQGTSFTWNVDLPAGTQFSTELKDSSGQPVYSGIQTVEPGDSTSCENSAVMESGSSTATSQTPAAAAAASTDMTMATSSHATSTVPSSSGSSGSATSSGSVTHITAAVQSSASTTSTSTATATATQNAAPQGSSINAFGIAGLLGLVGAALF